MAKYEFKKDPNRKKHKQIEETEITEPNQTFSIENFSKEKKNEVIQDSKFLEDNSPKMGRPRKNKVYSTIRLQRHNIHRINALQNSLNFETQDELIASLLDKAEMQLDSHQNDMYRMYIRTYQSRDERKKY